MGYWSNRISEAKPVLALCGWTLFVWLNRIRNIIEDDTLSGFDLTYAWGISVLFVVMAALAIHASASEPSFWSRALAIFSIGYWLIRAVQIALADHSVAFIAVHTLLATVSIGLGAWVLRSNR